MKPLRRDEAPAQAEPIEDRSEVKALLGEGFHTAFRKIAVRLTDDEWNAVLEFAFDRLMGAGRSIVRDPSVCGDYPAPCNCDDPLIHNGR